MKSFLNIASSIVLALSASRLILALPGAGRTGETQVNHYGQLPEDALDGVDSGLRLGDSDIYGHCLSDKDKRSDVTSESEGCAEDITTGPFEDTSESNWIPTTSSKDFPLSDLSKDTGFPSEVLSSEDSQDDSLLKLASSQ